MKLLTKITFKFGIINKINQCICKKQSNLYKNIKTQNIKTLVANYKIQFAALLLIISLKKLQVVY